MSSDILLMKEKFENVLKNRILKPNSALLTKEKYENVILDVKRMKQKK